MFLGSVRESVRLFVLGTIVIAAYAVLLCIGIAMIPLRIPEILQLAANRGFESLSMLRWIAQAPNSAPLNYFVQMPFLLVLGYTPLGARLDSLLFAIAASFLFFHLARRVGLAHPLLALLVFLLLPVHALLAVQGLPFEQALFFLLLATEWFLQLVEKPSIPTAGLYAVFLTLGTYSAPYAFLPAIGYVLFLLLFVNRAGERRAMWFALSATVITAALFLPYYLWALPQVNPFWPSRPELYGNAFEQSAGNEWAAYAAMTLFGLGILAAIWIALRWGAAELFRRIWLVCLLGGIVSSLAITAVADVWLGASFTADQLLWALPAAVLVAFAGAERLAARRRMRPVAAVFATLLIAACVAGDYFEFSRPAEDTAAEAALIAPELGGDACVVFVSERFSKVLFEVFAPSLQRRECLNFSHQRIVLASHPYVTREQQDNAESFFRGLNFSEARRIPSGGGQIVIMEQPH